MNSATGKAILSLVREGDYAHPGEERAIDLVFAPLAMDPARQLLDIGCGRGGTADYVRSHGWGQVAGVDIDAETLAEAARRYPEVSFVAADVTGIGDLWQGRFDLLYLFNSFYAFPDQPRALGEMARVARPGATLVLFDYTAAAGTVRFPDREQAANWTPLDLERLPQQLRDAGWELVCAQDVSSSYLAWYRELCGRIEAQQEEITRRFGREWYDHVHAVYADLLALIEAGTVGGAVIRATRG
jgi:ubiquinone/menaquinone biosynthesis C-methylase UbiE